MIDWDVNINNIDLHLYLIELESPTMKVGKSINSQDGLIEEVVDHVN
ncbi:MAG: hypothetical protein KAJ92_05435 [Gammaproteobacteria bacterium]|nr:hypothetical protein [Gammaproteobacteria bacterium]MCK5263106.1 hypothetical protein [Gammaproteobacteria bacterium]